MARQITPPAEGEDVRTLYKKVAELCEAVNALMNMTVEVEGQLRMRGKLQVGNGSSIMKIHSYTEVGSLGT